MLSGKSHKVVTGVSVCKKNENLKKSFHSITEVKIKPLSDDVIKFYMKILIHLIRQVAMEFKIGFLPG